MDKAKSLSQKFKKEGGTEMDKEIRNARRVYIGVALFLTTVMLAGAVFLTHSFYA